ncbi:helix-turn-helix transcriptional regulator [Flavobacterium sp. UMI-01]|uniref:helix-turn-helix transcriptional regulator n=1 Tax=Flavobacterium sp. UMI-01 TaxID=1441053 RepID=UPI001C7D9542|nr:helix-turn-helix transcriptional regulator [Flavobacterium sp. UMI-01]GIZ08397.1 hypothetical protein FUMI01_11240 [Flavobacterium sp. UMI-01]
MDKPREKEVKVAEIIRAARLKKGMTQEELANEVGVSRSTIIRVEDARYSPNAAQLYVILEKLEIPLIIGNEKI